jgi:hypothetical protein
VLEALQRLAPALVRHLVAYGELLCDEAGDALRQSRRRVMGLAVILAAGFMTVGLGCLWAIAASWDGPNRLVVVGGLCGLFALVTLGALLYSRGGAIPGRSTPFERLRAEWRADMHELARLDPTFELVPSQTPAAAPARSVRGN